MQKTIELSHPVLEVTNDLKSSPKQISSKFFYDHEGSRIFQQIMSTPEYYLTDCEAEIFETKKREIRALLCQDCCSLDIVELGAGEGAKTKILVEELLAENLQFRYIPIDISEEALVQLAGAMKQQFPELILEPRIGDYFQMIGNLTKEYPSRKVIMFLGSNLGNFNWDQSIKFLQGISQVLSGDDLFFMGLDLKKDPDVITRAYNDPQGFTRKFNVNLLTRFNREFGANFDLDRSVHAPLYDPRSGTASSFLVSTTDQEVTFALTGETISFRQWEAVQTEISQKYDLSMIEELARASGFKLVENFFDSRRYFVNSLWKKA